MQRPRIPPIHSVAVRICLCGQAGEISREGVIVEDGLHEDHCLGRDEVLDEVGDGHVAWGAPCVDQEERDGNGSLTIVVMTVVAFGPEPRKSINR